ncbi:MAG: hypothetical protein RLZZ519_699 [Bacteroidota bacterium]|jgi:hypothetical protein
MEVTYRIINVATDEWRYGDVAKKLQGMFKIEINQLFTVVLIPDLAFSQTDWDHALSSHITKSASPEEAKMVYACSSEFVVASSPASSYMFKSFEIEYSGGAELVGQTFEEMFGQKTFPGYIQWVPQEVMDQCLIDVEAIFDATNERDPENWPIKMGDFEVLRLIQRFFVDPGYATVPPFESK